MDRLACVDVPSLPLQLLLKTRSDWRAGPAAVVEADRPQAPVLYVNAAAHRAGVRIGQRYAAALAFAADLQAAPVPASVVDEGVDRIVARLRRYSPHIEPASGSPGVFWLDASGLERLYPRLEDWAEAIRADLDADTIVARVAVGTTRFGAYALARSARTGVVICADSAAERDAIEHVALGKLDFDPDVLSRLHVLGIETVGDFLQLPGRGLAARFGADVAARHRRASGVDWSPLVPVPAGDPLDRQIHLDAPIRDVGRLIFLIKRLLDAILASVARRAHAVHAIHLALVLDNRTTVRESVRPAAPSLDAVSLLSLVRLRFDTLSLPAGVVTLRVGVGTSATEPQSGHLLPRGMRDPERARRALARVRAELGETRVVSARLDDAHVPALQFTWVPCEHVPATASPRVVAARSLVRRFFPSAVPITRAEAARIVRRMGPYDVSCHWWASGIARRYGFARTDDDDLWWIYTDGRAAYGWRQGCVE
ncbi:MAG TPA: DNA polymerase Y family protein [Vicinamibacterales bacterium]|nr:DNA polymerase Y family protein [Vicinamibacterales bacterium]